MQAAQLLHAHQPVRKRLLPGDDERRQVSRRRLRGEGAWPPHFQQRVRRLAGGVARFVGGRHRGARSAQRHGKLALSVLIVISA